MHMGMHIMLFIMVDAVISRSSRTSKVWVHLTGSPLPWQRMNQTRNNYVVRDNRLTLYKINVGVKLMLVISVYPRTNRKS